MESLTPHMPFCKPYKEICATNLSTRHSDLTTRPSRYGCEPNKPSGCAFTAFKTYGQARRLKSVKGNLGRLLAHVDILEESAIGIVLLLLDSRAELHELLGYGLVGLFEDIDQTTKRISQRETTDGKRQMDSGGEEE